MQLALSAYQVRSRRPEARRAAEEAARLAPYDDDAHFAVGLTSKRRRAKRAAYHRALALNPAHASAANNELVARGRVWSLRSLVDGYLGVLGNDPDFDVAKENLVALDLPLRPALLLQRLRAAAPRPRARRGHRHLRPRLGRADGGRGRGPRADGGVRRRDVAGDPRRPPAAPAARVARVPGTGRLLAARGRGRRRRALRAARSRPRRGRARVRGDPRLRQRRAGGRRGRGQPGARGSGGDPRCEDPQRERHPEP